MYSVAVQPRPPPGMTPAALEYWTYYQPILEEDRILTKADRDVLRLYCEALARLDYLKHPDRLDSHDTQRRQWHDKARLTGQELGLSPSSRSRVSKIPEPEGLDPFEEFIH